MSTASDPEATLLESLPVSAVASGAPDVQTESPDRPVPVSLPELDRVVEALLFATPNPLKESRLREITGASSSEVAAAVLRLNQQYTVSDRTFRIHHIAQGYQLYTRPEYSEWVKQLFKTQRITRLSRAGLEVLAIVAYKQPVTKPEIEQLRGVDSTGPIDTLLERRLIALAGRAHKPGHPFLYRTSTEFLRYFGLAGVQDLPRPEELEGFLSRRESDQLPLPDGRGPAQVISSPASIARS